VQPSVEPGNQDKKALAYPTPIVPVTSKPIVRTEAPAVSVVSPARSVPIVTPPVSRAPVVSKPAPLRTHHNRSRVIVVARPKQR